MGRSSLAGDNERGQELGRKVGENVWRRAQQFILGTASPETAVFAALRPPFWFHDNEAADQPAHFDAASGLAIDLPPGGAGVWRSIVVDAMPAGAYELKLKAKVTGDPSGSRSRSTERKVASRGDHSRDGSDGVVTIPWTSDGVRSFRVSIEARADGGGARLLVSAIKALRVWPTVAGSPRYYEPSSVGHPDQGEPVR